MLGGVGWGGRWGTQVLSLVDFCDATTTFLPVVLVTHYGVSDTQQSLGGGSNT